MEGRNTIRKSVDLQMVHAYLNFNMPKMAPNFIDLLPDKYHFADSPGHEEFCAAYELEYEQGRPIEARELYETACRLGHPLANYCYGLWFLAGDRPETEKDLRKAFQKFCVAHKAGLGQATYQLADFYRTGKGKVVNRDAKKSFAFLHQSILDPRIHYAVDVVPFCLLGLAYGLGRGPSTASMIEAVRCFEKAIRYAQYQQHSGLAIVFGGPIIVDSEFTCMYQLALLAVQWDPDEVKRQIALRLDAMEALFASFPPGRAMMSVSEFAIVAKSFGLDYDEYLKGLSEGKGCKRVTWKSFRIQTDGRARALYTYERQVEIERWAPLEPDDEDLRKFLAEVDLRTAARMEDANDQWLPADEYYEMPPAPEGILPMSTLGGEFQLFGADGQDRSNGVAGDVESGAGVSDYVNGEFSGVTGSQADEDGNVPMPKNGPDEVVSNGVSEDGDSIPKKDEPNQE